MQPKFVIVDCETTGLDPEQNIILEIGIQVYTARLDLISQWSGMASDETTYRHLDWLADQEDKYVHNMHMENGLIWNIRHSTEKTHRDLELEAIQFMKDNGLGENRIMLPMCGSSILFDRSFIQRQMPDLNKQFHYRNMDVSSMKEFCKVWRPELISKYYEETAGNVVAHRVLSDCVATRNELAFYAENLFLEG